MFTSLVSDFTDAERKRKVADRLGAFNAAGATDTAELKFVFDAVEESIKAANFAQSVRPFHLLPLDIG